MTNTIDNIFSEILGDLGDFDSSKHDTPELHFPKDSSFPFIEMDEPSEIVPIDIGIEYDLPQTVERTAESGRIFEGGIREVGFEVFAFYKSRRDIDSRPCKGKWGIFYLYDGINFLEEEIAATYPGYGNPRKLALEFLRQHELHHYESDVSALMMEAVSRRHLYAPLRHVFRRHGTYSVEEALANRRVWDWAKKGGIGMGEFAFDLMKCQPNAYARFDEPLIYLQSEYAQGLLNLSFVTPASMHPIARWIVSVPKTLQIRSLCPEYMFILPDLSRWIRTPFGLPSIKMIEDSETVVEKLNRKYMAQKNTWEDRKIMLQKNPMAKSLHFRLWDKAAKEWSVNVDGNFRAHIRDMGNGFWITHDLDTHPKMGHGK